MPKGPSPRETVRSECGDDLFRSGNNSAPQTVQPREASIHVQYIEDPTRLFEIQDEWQELADRSSTTTPFQSPAWLLPWWSHLFGGGRLFTVLLRNNGRLVALAPMFIYGRSGEPRTLTLLGAGISDYCGPVMNGDLFDPLLHAIRDRSADWDLLDWTDLPPGGFERCTPCPVVDLPASFSDYEASLSPKFRHNLRNARNRLNRIGATFETATEETLPSYLNALFLLHADRWRARNESGVLDDPRLQAFHRQAASELLRRGHLRLHALRIEGEFRAIVYVLVKGSRSYYYLGGFDPAWERFSPGNVLIGQAIEHALHEGCTSFDFLRNAESYKYRWGARDQWSGRLRVTANELGASDVSRGAVAANTSSNAVVLTSARTVRTG